MNICFLASARSIHTVRWANSLVERGHNVSIVTLHPSEGEALDSKVKEYQLSVKNSLGYYLNILELKRILNMIKPDILNTHYASGYGTLSRLVKFRPTLLSIWGSDVYLYPYKSRLNSFILKKNLKAPCKLASTSRAMKNQTKLFISKESEIEITPFGIDLNVFNSLGKSEKEQVVIGTVKGLESIYGIDILIKSVGKLIRTLEKQGKQKISKAIRLEIVGEGSELNELIQLAEEERISHITNFSGKIPTSDIPERLNQFDIFCALSRSESFGVAVLEASACEIPVIVSNIGGLPEVVSHNKTGYIVDNKKIDEVVERLIELVENRELRNKMGINGRAFVEKYYDWKQSVQQMENIYYELANITKET